MILAMAWMAAILALAACEGPGPRKLGNATLAALARGSEPVPEEAKDAPVVEVMPDTTPTIPGAKVVKLAIDRRVPWGMVHAIVTKMQSQGQTPVLLVAERDHVMAFHLDDELDGEIIEILTYTNGKLCVKHPEVAEAKCAQSANKRYIDGAYTRELVREAVKGYERQNAVVELPQALTWADVVSAVGGARSCCENAIRVKVKDAEY